jgi:hypothetical protein
VDVFSSEGQRQGKEDKGERRKETRDKQKDFFFFLYIDLSHHLQVIKPGSGKITSLDCHLVLGNHCGDNSSF